MKNIVLPELEQLNNPDRYQPLEHPIYRDLQDDGGFADCRMAISIELEDGDSAQYPLEDILDKFLVHVEDFVQQPNAGNDHVMMLILGGDFENLKQVASIVGKRVYNEEYKDENGDMRVKLVIE